MIELPKQIGSLEDAEKFAEILVWDFGMDFYDEESYMTRDEYGAKVKRIAHILSECSRSNILFEKGFDDSVSRKPIKDLIQQCYCICDLNGVHFSDILIYETIKKEDSRTPHFDE